MAVEANSLIRDLQYWSSTIVIQYQEQLSKGSKFVSNSVQQSQVFTHDLTTLPKNALAYAKYSAVMLVQQVALLALSPIALVADLGRIALGRVQASRCFAQIIGDFPITIVMTTLASLHIVDSALSAVATGVGFLAWHGAERAVRVITQDKATVLSNNSNIRQIVYESKGITLLALGASFVRYPQVALFALPIILGSLYGTINNQFTVRNCPEYYTMGHYYDGEKLDSHAIKTNNLIIKPITTGCYATTAVTKIAGVLLALAGTLRYTQGAKLPVSWAAAMIGGVSVVSLVAGHILAQRKTASIEAKLEAFANLHEFSWTEEQKNKTFVTICEEQEQNIQNKVLKLANNQEALADFLDKTATLRQSISNDIIHEDLPVKYIAGWASNNTRNTTGYLAAGLGTLAVTITTVALRTLVL